MIEQTLSIIKPDAIERNLENKIKDFFKEKNLKIVKSKKVQISKEEASEFYKVHQTKAFYNDLCNYLSSGPIVVMVLEGDNAVLQIESSWEQQTHQSQKMGHLERCTAYQ